MTEPDLQQLSRDAAGCLPNEFKVGDRVRMLVDAYDADPDNAYPPGYVARCGEELIVRKIGAPTFIYPISVSHEHIKDRSFGVKADEIELVKEQPMTDQQERDNEQAFENWMTARFREWNARAIDTARSTLPFFTGSCMREFERPLREGVQAIAAFARDREFADLLTDDPDLLALEEAFQSMAAEISSLQGTLRLYDKLDKARATLPSGMRMVPVEPTEEMLAAARDWSSQKYGKPIGNDAASGCYTAMLAAAPQQPAEKG